MAAKPIFEIACFFVLKISNGGECLLFLFLYYRGKNGINRVKFIEVKMAGIYIIPILFFKEYIYATLFFKFQIVF